MELGESNKDKLKLLREEACKSFIGLDDIGGAWSVAWKSD